MIEGLKPYPAYKDSGVPWLGKIPEHWEVRRLKQVCRMTYGDSLPTETRQHGDVDVFGSNGKVGSHAVANTLSPCIVIGRKGSFGKINFSKQPVFAIDTTYFVDERCTKTDLRWLYYLLGWLRLDEVSRDSAVPGLDRDEAYLRVAPNPISVAEQCAIGRFLDYAGRRIQRYIRAKRKLIGLLNEQKQAIIHAAVTRGLHPAVRLKPSGVEWLGEVPEHWQATRLKFVANVQTGLTLGKVYQSNDLEERPYLRVANVQSGYLDLSRITQVRVPKKEAESCALQYGDVLMTEGGDIDKLGRGYIWRGEIPGCLHQNHVFAVRAKSDQLLPEFLVALMTSSHGRDYFWQTAKKTTNLASTNTTTLKAFPLFLPGVEEQHGILERIASDTAKLEDALERAHREIDLLREYRTRLIADVVTGRLDVREAAARRPDEEQEADGWDEGGGEEEVEMAEFEEIDEDEL